MNSSKSKIPKLGIGGPVGSGKTRLIERLIPILKKKGPANEIPAYIEKYHEDILQIDMTLESMAKEYSTAIYVKPNWIRFE